MEKCFYTEVQSVEEKVLQIVNDEHVSNTQNVMKNM